MRFDVVRIGNKPVDHEVLTDLGIDLQRANNECRDCQDDAHKRFRRFPH
jgi:hypothetical protein